jgi:hypothetical protein
MAQNRPEIVASNAAAIPGAMAFTRTFNIAFDDKKSERHR